MHMLHARNGHSLLPIALDRLFKVGVKRSSRNGEVLKLPGPVLICLERPCERVMFWPERDANPFFHFMEALGYLAGRGDLAYYSQYLPRMEDFSDDGKHLFASYGWRWRNYFGRDQLTCIANRLRIDRDDRRQVLAMWDGREDLIDQGNKKDVPCNTTAYFAVNEEGHLDLTICNRSNDLVWGFLGANMVHFSILLEYVALKASLTPGRMYTLSNNLHGYVKTVEPLRGLVSSQHCCPYELGLANTYRLGFASEMGDFDEDLLRLGVKSRYQSQFFRAVVSPLEEAYRNYKANDFLAALACAKSILAQDWSLACCEWLERRIKRRAQKDDETTHAKQS